MFSTSNFICMNQAESFSHREADFGRYLPDVNAVRRSEKVS
jgi:hypothetical protein